MHCYPQELRRTCPACKDPIDPFGYHSTPCGTYNDRTSRHDSQCDLYALAGGRTGKSVVSEHKHLIPDTQKKPGDVTIASWRGMTMAAFDFTFVSPFAVSVLQQSAVRRGYAAECAEASKREKSAELCRKEKMDFVPMAVETCGGWGKTALVSFWKLSILVAARFGKTHEEELRWMLQRHSAELQRGNARMILRRASEFEPL